MSKVLNFTHINKCSTLKNNKKAVEQYVRNQLEEDMMTDQITIKEYVDPFKG